MNQELIIFNIGYSRTSVLSIYPVYFYGTPKMFFKELRYKYNIKRIFKWAKDNHVPPSLMCIFFTILIGETERSFTINLFGIREYKKHWDSIYKSA